MEQSHVLDLARDAVLMAFQLGAPVMLIAVLVGLLISILQAITQVQDQTISFVPKIIAMIMMMLITLPWSLSRMMEYTTQLYQNIATNL